MTTRDSSSGLDSSSMDDQPSSPKRTVSLDPSPEPEPEPEPGAEKWVQNFNRSFREVQAVLDRDRNRALIQQVNDNHQSRLPANMVKNVSLIQEINANISKVVSLYSDLSSDFSTVFRNKNDDAEKPNNN